MADIDRFIPRQGETGPASHEGAAPDRAAAPKTADGSANVSEVPHAPAFACDAPPASDVSSQAAARVTPEAAMSASARASNPSGAPRVGSLKVLVRTIRQVGADRTFLFYLVFLALCCAFLRLWEPQTFPTIGAAVWCCFETITTVGFGDVVPVTTLGRAVVMAVGLSALFVVALITGVVVSFYNEKMRIRRRESFMEFEHNLEHLSELSSDELCDMENRYRRFIRERR